MTSDGKVAAPVLETDLLIVGSGAGGMTAALTAALSGLETLVVEKAGVYGGSTALSGGGVWVPNNPTLEKEGISDSTEDVVTYLREITEGRVPLANLQAYAHHGPQMLRFLMDRCPNLRFSWCPGYSDYHPERPGGRAEGRSIECLPFDLRRLGGLAATQRRAHMGVPAGLVITAADYVKLNMVARTWGGRRRALRVGLRAVVNRLLRRDMVSLGQALVGRLRLSLAEAGVPVWLDTPLVRLLRDGSGLVTGALVDRNGEEVRIHARRGVLLATGGFEHNDVMRKEYLPEVAWADLSGGADSNTGDGILAGQAMGASVALMDDAWWMPSIRRPDGKVHALVSERSIPPSLIVTPEGSRFTNESSPYVTFVHEQLRRGLSGVWFVMDHKARRRYQFGAILPGKAFPPSWYDSGLAHRADSIAELALSIGVPEANLIASVARFNELASAGHDTDHARGESAYDRYYGDPTLPNPAMDVLDEGPYYAIRVEAGDLGTKGGLVCDENARVLDEDGEPIPGLYATGNTAASVMGNEYAGAGATIGPAMVFGYVGARHAAGVL